MLKPIYDDRLAGVVLYDSEARGGADVDSNIDLLVLLKGPVALERELGIIIRAVYPLQLEIYCPIHGLPVDVDTYQAGKFAFYRDANDTSLIVFSYESAM